MKKATLIIFSLFIIISVCSCNRQLNTEPEKWTCESCGQSATGQFCSNCGAKRPEPTITPAQKTHSDAISTIAPVPVSTTYTYLNDKWDLYVATLISEKTIKIENWGRFSAGSDGDPFKHEYDVSVISTEDTSIDFHWLDDNHISFSIVLNDENNYYWEEPRKVCFVANDRIAESSAGSNRPIYTFRNDKWNQYVAILLSDNIIKIENWGRFSAGKDGDPFAYQYDVCVVDTNNNEFGFRWLDADRSAFSLTMQDKENDYYWNEPCLVGFASNDTITDTNAKQNNTVFTYRNDKWNQYVAVALSDSVIKIENWGRFSAGADGDPFEYQYDVCVIDTNNSEAGLQWLDASHSAFSLTMQDKENEYYWNEPCLVGFVLNDTITDSNANQNKTIYTYRNDKWNQYVAVLISDSVVKIENWGRFDAGADGDPFAYQYDVCVIDTNINEADFRWLDADHSAFSLILQDEENYYWKESNLVGFVLNSDYLESSANRIVPVYIYLNDKWDLYTGVVLSDKIIKIENWSSFFAGDNGDPFVYEYDVAIINTESDGLYSFSWMDEGHSAFSVKLQDSNNSKWNETSTVSFAICSSFTESYLEPALKYLKASDEKTTDSIEEPNAPSGNNGDRFSDRGITYELQNGKLIAIEYDGTRDSISIPSSVSGYPVVTIGDSLFENCSTIQSITIWADIEIVGDAAFKGCTSLTYISLPTETTLIGAHAFEGCTALENVVLWGNPSIDQYAFKGCSSLTSISISSGTELIGAHAFEECTALETVIIWGNTSIEEYAFKNCSSINSISISSGTDHIGAHAFENCTSIDSVIIWGVNTIGEYAFAGCTSIVSMSFPHEVQIIGAHAFDGCSNLESVVVWSNDTVIGKDAFANCPKLH